MIPKVAIGSTYRPERFEVRTPMDFQSRMPIPSDDAVRVQRWLTPAALRWIGDPTSPDTIVGWACSAIVIGTTILAWTGHLK